ncbi:hypothetical protein CRI94_11905 [Longibacter salinarum]|uniref:AI-2E family transporter n=1 Tax=Longibacter salinarum TaxID=1850348 RepID=A0A2A8CVJ0_9BACT|nr:AI-2E family transporter [Longibacter salinarum]PEN12725.1 hypothetical protein CRI94_11905 [Longibacter salinarum]
MTDPEQPTAEDDITSQPEPSSDSQDSPSWMQPDITELGRKLKNSLGVVQGAVVGLFILAAVFALDAAAAFVIPILVAHLLDRLLSPLVRGMGKVGIPKPMGAAIVLFGFAGIIGGGVYYLSGPAMEWVESAPRNLQIAEYKLRGMTDALEKMQEAAQKVDEATDMEGGESGQTVRVQEQSTSELLMSQAQTFISGLLITLFLLFFLLASGDLFLRKLVSVLPRFRHRRNAVRIVRRTEENLTHYLTTLMLINTGLGAALAAAMYLLGMPNPLLWGVLGGLLNFIPYIGPLVNIVIVTIVALVSFESVTYALLPGVVYLIINGIEGSVVTPALMGWRLRLNPIVIFIGLTFWTWIWGITGGLLAVPLLATIKIICDSITVLRPVAVLMGR